MSQTYGDAVTLTNTRARPRRVFLVRVRTNRTRLTMSAASEDGGAAASGGAHDRLLSKGVGGSAGGDGGDSGGGAEAEAVLLGSLQRTVNRLSGRLLGLPASYLKHKLSTPEGSDEVSPICTSACLGTPLSSQATDGEQQGRGAGVAGGYGKGSGIWVANLPETALSVLDARSMSLAPRRGARPRSGR